MKTLKELLHKAFLVYPTVFILTLLVIGRTTNSEQNEYILLEEPQIPLGIPAPTPILYKQASVNSASITLVYEKGTNQYLLYSGFKCLGRIEVRNESIDALSAEELLCRVIKLE